MRSKCPLCGKRKAQRSCGRHHDALICSQCCAGLRGSECGDCRLMAVSQRYRTARSTPRAIQAGHFIAEIDPEVERAVNAALELAQQGAVEKAWPMINRLHREHPRNHTVYYAMGTLHALQEEYDKAGQCFDQAIEIFPYMIEAHFNRAVMFQKQLDVKNAIRAYRKVVEIGPPDDSDVRKARSFIDDMENTIRANEGVDLDVYLETMDEFDRAFERFRRGEWSPALAGFRAVAAKTERNAPTHGNMGLCLAQLGRKAEALAEIDRALEIDPDYQPARINRAAIEAMEEGIPLQAAGGVEVEYNKQRVQHGRESGLHSFFDRLLRWNKKPRD